MSLFEFFYLSFYLGFLTAVIVMVQLYEVTKKKEIPDDEKEKEVVEESWSDTEDENLVEPFDPEKEQYTMTENPMLRHRTTLESQTS